MQKTVDKISTFSEPTISERLEKSNNLDDNLIMVHDALENSILYPRLKESFENILDFVEHKQKYPDKYLKWRFFKKPLGYSLLSVIAGMGKHSNTKIANDSKFGRKLYNSMLYNFKNSDEKCTKIFLKERLKIFVELEQNYKINERITRYWEQIGEDDVDEDSLRRNAIFQIQKDSRHMVSLHGSFETMTDFRYYAKIPGIKKLGDNKTFDANLRFFVHKMVVASMPKECNVEDLEIQKQKLLNQFWSEYTGRTINRKPILKKKKQVESDTIAERIEKIKEIRETKPPQSFTRKPINRKTEKLLLVPNIQKTEDGYKILRNVDRKKRKGNKYR